MNFITTICIALTLCHIGSASASFIKCPTEQFEGENVQRFNSPLKPSAPTPNTRQSDSSILQDTCNGVLNASTGGISYKAFQPISENERCIWTIRAGGVGGGGFNLTILTVGSLGSSDTQLIATCLSFRNMPRHVLLNQTGPVNGISACSLLVITFATGNDIAGSTGFVLEYSELRPGTISPQSVDHIVDAGNGGFLRHPSEASHYTNSELSTFIFVPGNNDQDKAVERSINVMYFRGTLDTNYICYDHLRVLRFNKSSTVPTKWQDEGLICADTASDLIVSPDLLLITFDTDSSITGTGFQFAFTETSTYPCS
ncbi:unnamed protein product [Orchesella dallaii]|uniref:CUB domain-containing protein n=1 Tax=Orchesella dallaii TaxID=48710 RepID=A0ABP1RZV8_9HEXA